MTRRGSSVLGAACAAPVAWAPSPRRSPRAARRASRFQHHVRVLLPRIRWYREGLGHRTQLATLRRSMTARQFGPGSDSPLPGEAQGPNL